MELKSITYRYNPLLERREVYAEVDHSAEGSTPTRASVRQLLAEHFGVELDRVVVRKIETITGAMVARVEAHIYDTPEAARFIEPEHVLRRNQLTAEGEGKSAEPEEGGE